MSLLGNVADRRLAASRDEDDGFSIIELLVSMIVIGVLLAGMATVQVKALATVTLSRQRQQATDLANRAMEQMRALPYDTVSAGLNSSDLAGDPNITAGRFRPTYNASIDEILVSGASAAAVPLYPHVQANASTFIGAVQFKISSYVTLVSAAAGDTTKGYWLTVIASWSSAQSHGVTKTVSTRSQLFSPSGCLSTATHPFSGPCQALFDGQAGDTPAGISLSSGTAGRVAFDLNSLEDGGVSAPSLSSVLQSEQTISTQSRSVTSGAKYKTSVGETVSGEAAAATGATTDPATGVATLPSTDTAIQTPPATVNGFGSDSTFTFNGGSSDNTSAASTTISSGATGCLDLADVAVASGQACSSGKFTPGGAMGATLLYSSKTIELASIAPSVTQTRAFTARYLTSGGAYCATASGIGCISANAARSFGTAVIGKAPPSSAGLPGGYAQMAMVTGYSDSAKAEAGTGAGPPSAARAGTLTYWGGAGSNISLDLASAAAQTLALAPVTYTYAGMSAPVTVAMSGTISITATGTSTVGVLPCQPTACDVSATSGSVVAQVTYDIYYGGGPVGHFTVTVDLGTALAKASFRAAPLA